MSENKVWVVLEGYNYEGYSKPEGVFSSKELAEAVAAKRRADKYQPDYVDVFEYEVDVDLDPSPEISNERH
jgi:hypothetical protein